MRFSVNQFSESLHCFLFAALSEVMLKGIFHLLLGQLVEDTHTAVLSVITFSFCLQPLCRWLRRR